MSFLVDLKKGVKPYDMETIDKTDSNIIMLIFNYLDKKSVQKSEQSSTVHRKVQ